ncbi:DUF6282 family protein [Thermodesulfobacteriota bacterium]
MKEITKSILENSVDFHVHVSPDPYTERVVNIYEAALQAKNIGMRGIVIKSHYYPTAPIVLLTKENVEGIEIIGSLALNHSIGGINPYAVEASAKMGAKVIWMPTVSSVAVRNKKGLSDGIPIIGDNGKVLPDVKEILSLVRENDLILCTGHLTTDEIIPLFSEALDMKVNKFVVTHPLKVAGTSIDLNIQKELAERGAFIEHCFGATFSLRESLDPFKIVEAIKFVGVDRCILSTDFGKFHKPLLADGMRIMLATLFECGLSEQELTILVKKNPYQLLNL